MDVIPGFVEAIRASAKVLQHHDHRLFLDHEAEYREFHGSSGTNDDGEATLQPPPRNSVSIHDQLMNRVQNAADTARNTKEKAQCKRLEKQKMAIEVWIDSVKQFAYQTAASSNERQITPEQQQRTPQYNNDQQQQQNRKERPSVPYACFLYLWDLQQETPTKLHVRRAALYLSYLLLQKSKDCRFHLQMESNLADWIVQMTTVPPKQKREQQESISLALLLLQHEALRLLEQLQEQGYGSLYPKIAVAATRLRQQCLPLVTSSKSDGEDDLLSENHPTLNGNDKNVTTIQSNSTVLHRNMVDWRIIRDLALKYGSKELGRLQKIIAKSHESLEILVPRMGQELYEQDKEEEAQDPHTIEPPNNAAASSVTNDNNEEEDENDEDIDWEDGDEELEEKEQELMANHHHPVHHLLAVDRTLAAMQSAAGGLRGGELEIDMRKTEKEEEAIGKAKDSLEARRKVEAKAKLTRLVKILREKHLPRLTLWLDGLVNADNLVKKSNAALILLPASSIQQRQMLIRELTASKKSVSSILSSAVRLEEKSKAAAASTDTEENTNAKGNAGENNHSPFMFGAAPRPSATRRIQPMLVSRGESQIRSALASAIARHQKRKKVSARSSRIQIKVKSK